MTFPTFVTTWTTIAWIALAQLCLHNRINPCQFLFICYLAAASGCVYIWTCSLDRDITNNMLFCYHGHLNGFKFEGGPKASSRIRLWLLNISAFLHQVFYITERPLERTGSYQWFPNFYIADLRLVVWNIYLEVTVFLVEKKMIVNL
jgi:ABC-type transport system involved in cytochrome c biogenesis permease subunit